MQSIVNQMTGSLLPFKLEGSQYWFRLRKESEFRKENA